MRDLYSTLGLPRGVSQVSIKKAYRQLAQSLHPDKNPGDKEAEERFKEITHAYQVLSDPVQKAAYDKAPWQRFGRSSTNDRPFSFGSGVQNSVNTFFQDVLAEILKRNPKRTR